MILPIVAYGDSALRKVGKEIDKDYPNLYELIENMFETMHEAPGVGLAAHQIGLPIRLFIVDSNLLLQASEGNSEDQDDRKENGNSEPQEEGITQAFINPTIIEEYGNPWKFEEGCLSIPTVREDVEREEHVKIQYYDQDFNFHEKEFSGLTARVIQHEYDHIEGILFTDHLKPLKKQLLRRKLSAISKGDVNVSYKMKFPIRKKSKV